MDEPTAAGAAPQGRDTDTATHEHAVFEGIYSRRHNRTKLWKLRLRAEAERIRRRRALMRVHTLVQFVGFPRSGHSLIGALLDAHANAVVAHELDAMGLFRKGVPVSRLPSLIAWNSQTFSEHGRYWNGLCYKVADTRHTAAKRPQVVGDKKGDWAARWCADDPSLIEAFQARSPYTAKWILVTRHPMDNVATMSLRQGKLYDRLRIEAEDGAAFHSAVAAAQKDGRIATRVSDAMVTDYRALAAAVAAMKARTPREHWLEIAYEDFVASPRGSLDRLTAFLGLEAETDWSRRATALVHGSARRSRDSVQWSEHQRSALMQTIAAHDFLGTYAHEP